MNFWKQVAGWEICVFVLCAVFIIYYFAKDIDFENMLKKDSPVPMHMGGKIAPTAKLKGVSVVNIPSNVYESLSKEHRCKRYLTDNQKWVIFVTFPCGGLIPYERAFKKTFHESDLSEYYHKRVVNVSTLLSFYCPRWNDMDDTSTWIREQCFKKTCIFNPQRKQLVIDNSLDENQLPILLEKYKEW